MKNHFGKNSLKIIVLAAGQGKRLQPLTNNKPKCMVELFGKTLLQRQIEIYRNCGISDITVVTGYYDSKINYPDIYKLKNKRYRTTNMVESLFCAQEKLFGSVIVSYGDIIFEKKIIKKLINSENDISIIIDKNWKDYWKIRFNDPLKDAESLVVDKNGFIQSIGQKAKNVEEIGGQFIGLMKFQNDGIKNIKKFYEKIKKISISGSNVLNTNLPFEKSFMTDFLQGLINFDYKLKAVFIKNGWLELDSLKDYGLYKKMHAEDTLKKFIVIEDIN